jgi:DNA-binding transcriptional regulator LsrR (DeoR family)
MKVSKVIEMLTKNYSPEEELVIMWWDKEVMANDDEVSDNAMAYADEVIENDQWLGSSIYRTIREAIDEFCPEIVEEEK